jgi:hypothetical protein
MIKMGLSYEAVNYAASYLANLVCTLMTDTLYKIFYFLQVESIFIFVLFFDDFVEKIITDKFNSY